MGETVDLQICDWLWIGRKCDRRPRSARTRWRSYSAPQGPSRYKGRGVGKREKRVGNREGDAGVGMDGKEKRGRGMWREGAKGERACKERGGR